MFKKLFYKSVTTLLISIAANTYGADISITGTINTSKTPVDNNVYSFSLRKAQEDKIALLKLDLSNKAKTTINQRLQKALYSQQYSNSPQNLPAKVQLGMSSVPVLNQGTHGSCVVFAVTAAIDAIVDKGDHVSQLCQLGLGKYLENHGYTPSGWNGAWARNVLGQIELFGYVTKDMQRLHGCAGLTEYPLCGMDVQAEESVADFHSISNKLSESRVGWSSIIDVFQASSNEVNEQSALNDVKRTIAKGDRVVLGVLLLDFEKGTVGAQGTHNHKFDTWVLTPEIANNMNEQTEYAGHALLITGYDDNAIATDEEGNSYQGLLSLRNSWGKNVGDNGEFYMSYSYFKALLLEAQRIRQFK